MKRILVWIGSRANYGRLKMLIDLLNEKYTVHIALGDYTIPDKLGNKTRIIGKVPSLMYYDSRTNMARAVGIVTQGVTTIIDSCKPYDLAIVHADRYENLGFATACSYAGIPLLHTEGGEVTGQIDNKVRNTITSLSDYHCAPTELSYKKLTVQGCMAWNTGSPAIDYIKYIVNKYSDSRNSDFVLALYNPSDDDEWCNFTSALSDISEIKNVFCVTPCYDPGWRDIAKRLHTMSKVVMLSDLPPNQFYELLRRCTCFVGNSSSGIKEGAYLGKPYVLVGNRQYGREVDSNVTKVPCIRSNIVNEVLSIPFGTRYKYTGLFGNGDAAFKIMDIIRSVIGV